MSKTYKTPGYVRGRSFEYRIKKHLEAMGLIVFRLAGSKPIDLIAISPKGRIYFIECKLRGHANREQRIKQENLAKRVGAEYVIITSNNKYDVLTQIRKREIE